MKRSDNGFEILLLIVWFILSIVLVTQHARAQDEQVSTSFQVTCLEALSEDHYRLHIEMTSEGVQAFTFALGDVLGSNADTLPYAGHATTNIPSQFETMAGVNDDWYLDAHSEDSPYTFNLLFTNDIGTATLPVNTWDNVPTCEPVQTPTPPVETAPMPLVVINAPIVAAVVSTGRTCVVKYPKVILVCNG